MKTIKPDLRGFENASVFVRGWNLKNPDKHRSVAAFWDLASAFDALIKLVNITEGKADIYVLKDRLAVKVGRDTWMRADVYRLFKIYVQQKHRGHGIPFNF